MRKYQSIFFVVLIFCFIGGYILADDILLGGSILFFAFSLLVFKWTLQNEHSRNLDKRSKKNE